jgi:SAM-dependent methyltransferase
MTRSPAVIWHDVECGRYVADLELWDELALREAGPILDVGAGTGRVALRLARAGHAVTALDRDPELLAALAERARDQELRIEGPAAGTGTATLRIVHADATDFDLLRQGVPIGTSYRRTDRHTYGLIIVPMQTIQLLPGADARAGFLASARRHLAPGGLLAAAVADALEGFDAEHTALPVPDVAEHCGWRFVSQPVAVRELPATLRIERIRQAVSPSGERTAEGDAVELARLKVETLEDEGRAAGLLPESARHVPATDEHVGSDVVMLRG